jgi:ABC-type cobalamin/Fe3+-siderophores transport system ATPase subunit
VRDFNRQMGMTIVMVTHERALAERYAERLVFMADGKVVAEELNSAGVAIAGAAEAGAEGARS